MKIGIDGFSLSRNDSGIEVYVRELLFGLINEQFPIELYTYTDVELPVHHNLHHRSSGLPPTIPSYRKLTWELFGIKNLMSADVGVFHSPHFILPYRIKKVRKVVTVHDLAFVRCPQFFDWKTRIYYKIFLQRSLIEADAIICISESCLNDVRVTFPAVRSKLHLVYNGFNDYSKIPPNNSVLSELSIDRPFLLMIGTLNPRKNLFNAIRAFEALLDEFDLELVIVGSVKNLPVDISTRNSRVKFAGYVDQSKLSALYRNAELLLFPSFYEGFGFPILEAMSLGLPVVTSNISSMPEISGYPKELLCDPYDIKSIKKVAVKLMDKGVRHEMQIHGYSNIKKYSWNRMVAQTANVYASL